MKFNYQARTKYGEIQTGTVEASSREAAFNLLKSYQLYVTYLEEVKVPVYAKEIKFLERVSRKEIVAFSRQLAIMFKSNIPLIEILQTIAKQIENPFFRAKVLDIAEKIEGGEKLSKALSYHSSIFSPFYINMIKSGEASGKLSEVFSYLADYLEKEYNFKSSIINSLIYPIFLFIVFILIMLLVAFMVLPNLATFLKEAGGELPLITRVLISVAIFIKNWIIFVILFLVLLAGSIYYFLKKTEKGKNFFDENILRIPLVKNFFKKNYLTRFALNLSTLISGGLPIVQAIETTSQVVGNNVYKKIILDVSEGVKKGEKISDVLQKYPEYVTPLFVQMVVVGEKTGKIDSSLLNIVNFYEKETNRSLENFVRLLEPILIIFFGFFVAFLMLSILLPMFSIISRF